MVPCSLRPTQEHGKLLLSKEWLVKNNDSTPYLFVRAVIGSRFTRHSTRHSVQKCYFSTVDLSCFILVTDTKTVWTEGELVACTARSSAAPDSSGAVLNSKQFARRWRACNLLRAPEFSREEDEEEWRISTLELLSKAHTLGGVEELTFDVVESNYAVSKHSAGTHTVVHVLLLCAGSRPRTRV